MILSVVTLYDHRTETSKETKRYFAVEKILCLIVILTDELPDFRNSRQRGVVTDTGSVLLLPRIPFF